MEKLSIEEKAKAYDEALERAKILYNDKNEIGYANAESVLEEVFPLLKESEDERIRKELIEHCRNTRCVTEEGAERIAKWISWLEKQEGCEYIKKDWLEHIKQSWYKEGFIDGKYTPKELTINDVATLNELIDLLENGTAKLQHDLTLYANWLKTQFPTNEKQSEQKPADKVEPKFKVGDWVVSPNGVYWHIDAIQNGRYEVTADTGQCGNWPLDTNIYRLWTIQDAKDGNVLTNGDFPCIFKRCDDNGSLYVYCGINAHNDFSILSEDPENVWDDYSKQYFPATKEQRDLLFQKMHEAGYEWDEEEKKLKETDNEEVNGEDYGIDGLWHAQRILEKTLGSVDGYQTDDGILSHQCAITAVKKLYEQKPKRMISAEAKEALYDKPDWSEKDENVLEDIEEAIINYWHGDTQDILLDWLKSLKDKYTWKPSDEQMKQLVWIAEQNKDNMIGKELISLYQDLKKLREG